MAHHIARGEEGEADAADAAQHFHRLAQTGARVARQIDLGDVAGDHRDRAEADAGQEHLHLLDRGVLRFVQNHVRVVEGTAAHIRQWRDLDHVALDQLGHLLEAEHFVQGVVQRAQIRVDFLRQVAGQEAEFLAGLHRRAHQQQTLHAVRLQRLDRAGHRQISLAGAGRAHAEIDVVAGDRVQVARLVCAAALDHAALDPDRHLLGAFGRRLGDRVDAGFSQVQVDPRAGQRFVFGGGVQRAQHLLGGPGRSVFADHLENAAAVVDLHAEPQFDLPQVLVERPAQIGEAGIVFGIEGEVALVEFVHRRARVARRWWKSHKGASARSCPQGTSCGRGSDFSRDAFNLRCRRRKSIATEVAPTQQAA